MKTVVALALLPLLALAACRRPDPGQSSRTEADLAGAWVREIRDGATGLEGFDLREDGSVALLGIFSMDGVAWAVSRGELVISTRTDRDPRPTPVRLRIASLDRDALSLVAEPAEYLAGTWRRGQVDRISGVVTYLERIALPTDARVEVRLLRGERLLARTLISPEGPVPIPFLISYLPDAVADERAALEARIVATSGALFETAEPLPVGAGASGVDLIVRPAPGAR
ncbi:MAG: hypothetical protein FJ108_14375 [Deltaproteobacteria bacterium]|nr:hypothetical protein [Deltaproteobacteria bacterium]